MTECHTASVVTIRMNVSPPQPKHMQTCTNMHSHAQEHYKHPINTLNRIPVFYKTVYVLLYRRLASLSKVRAFSFINYHQLRIFVEGKCILRTHFKKKLKGRLSSKYHEGRSIAKKNVSLPSTKVIFLLCPAETRTS